jgi:hypothetical protein
METNSKIAFVATKRFVKAWESYGKIFDMPKPKVGDLIIGEVVENKLFKGGLGIKVWPHWVFDASELKNRKLCWELSE